MAFLWKHLILIFYQFRVVFLQNSEVFVCFIKTQAIVMVLGLFKNSAWGQYNGGVAASGASSHSHSHCCSEPVVNLKGKEGQLEHKIQVSVFKYASLTWHKNQKWAYISEESRDGSPSSLNELIASCLKNRRQETRGTHCQRAPGGLWTHQPCSIKIPIQTLPGKQGPLAWAAH